MEPVHIAANTRASSVLIPGGSIVHISCLIKRGACLLFPRPVIKASPLGAKKPGFDGAKVRKRHKDLFSVPVHKTSVLIAVIAV